MGRKKQLPVIEKNGKFYNRLTKNYVNETTAKRLNSFFRKNPNATMYEAYGRPRYDPSKPWDQQAKTVKQIYKKRTQLVKTQTRKGKPIYFSPIQKKTVTQATYKRIRSFDYRKGSFRINLYRLTVDKGRVYHIITYPLQWSFKDHSDIDAHFDWLIRNWMQPAKQIISDIERKHPLSKVDVMHITFKHGIFSETMSSPGGVTVMEQLSPKTGLRFLQTELVRARTIYHTLLNNYRTIRVQNVKIYIYSFSTQKTKAIAESRMGIFKKRV